MYYIGVDLGGTNIAVGIVDEDCRIVKKASVPTRPERGADAIVAVENLDHLAPFFVGVV